MTAHEFTPEQAQYGLQFASNVGAVDGGAQS